MGTTSLPRWKLVQMVLHWMCRYSKTMAWRKLLSSVWLVSLLQSTCLMMIEILHISLLVTMPSLCAPTWWNLMADSGWKCQNEYTIIEWAVAEESARMPSVSWPTDMPVYWVCSIFNQTWPPISFSLPSAVTISCTWDILWSRMPLWTVRMTITTWFQMNGKREHMGTGATMHPWQQRNEGRETAEGVPETLLQLCSRNSPMATWHDIEREHSVSGPF